MTDINEKKLMLIVSEESKKRAYSRIADVDRLNEAIIYYKQKNESKILKKKDNIELWNKTMPDSLLEMNIEIVPLDGRIFYILDTEDLNDERSGCFIVLTKDREINI